MLGGVLQVGGAGVPGEGDNLKPLLTKDFITFTEFRRLLVAGRGGVAHVDGDDGRSIDQVGKGEVLDLAVD